MPLETEAQRQFYLGMAGIQLWYARNPQPGAAPSPDFDFGECLAAEAGSPAAPIKPRVPREKLSPDIGLARVQGLMKEVKSPPRQSVEPTPVVTEPDVKSPETKIGEPVATKAGVLEVESLDEGSLQVSNNTASFKNYSLAATWGVWITESCVLISTLSSDSSVQLQDGLANNILRAMGESVNTTRTFMWPVFRNPVVPGNDAEGFRLLLSEFASECQGKSFLGLGLLPDVPQGARAGWLHDALGPMKVDFPHGLAGIATYPERKRDLWSQLKSLLGEKR